MEPTLTELEQLGHPALLRSGPDSDGAAMREVLAQRAGRAGTRVPEAPSP